MTGPNNILHLPAIHEWGLRLLNFSAMVEHPCHKVMITQPGLLFPTYYNDALNADLK